LADSDGATKTIGFSFGSPALVGLRGTYQSFDSPWTIQGEYSNQVLEHNRSNGRLNTLRLDLQFAVDPWWETITPFYFVGGNYLNGYLNRESERFKVLFLELGSGLRMPVTDRWSVTSELGVSLPTQGAKGFQFMGVIINFGLRWSWI
jgi:hypothetical protein